VRARVSAKCDDQPAHAGKQAVSRQREHSVCSHTLMHARLTFFDNSRASQANKRFAAKHAHIHKSMHTGSTPPKNHEPKDAKAHHSLPFFAHSTVLILSPFRRRVKHGRAAMQHRQVVTVPVITRADSSCYCTSGYCTAAFVAGCAVSPGPKR
jgi:hypothetical protein